MTDLEIISWLKELEPETTEQEIKITLAINIFNKKLVNSDLVNSIDKFLEPLAWDEIEGKLTIDIYNFYLKWCNENDYKPASKNSLSIAIKKKYELTSVPRKFNGKCYRVYM